MRFRVALFCRGSTKLTLGPAYTKLCPQKNNREGDIERERERERERGEKKST